MVAEYHCERFNLINFVIFYRIASAEDLTSLRGVGLFESATFTGRNGVSYAGGAELLITGSHFDETPWSNSVFFSTSALSTSTQRLAGPPLTRKRH